MSKKSKKRSQSYLHLFTGNAQLRMAELHVIDGFPIHLVAGGYYFKTKHSGRLMYANMETVEHAVAMYKVKVLDKMKGNPR